MNFVVAVMFTITELARLRNIRTFCSHILTNTIDANVYRTSFSSIRAVSTRLMKHSQVGPISPYGMCVRCYQHIAALKHERPPAGRQQLAWGH